jgi:hypothetical protein
MLFRVWEVERNRELLMGTFGADENVLNLGCGDDFKTL